MVAGQARPALAPAFFFAGTVKFDISELFRSPFDPPNGDRREGTKLDP
jgi:hypothetical protein